MELKIKAVSPKIGGEIPFPYYASAGAAAMDLHACLDEPLTIAPRALVSIPTGVAIALPSADYVALVFARSGLGIKHGITLSNGVGVIDSDYRGESRVGLTNLSDTPYTVQPGDRVAGGPGPAGPGRGPGRDRPGRRRLRFHRELTPFSENEVYALMGLILASGSPRRRQLLEQIGLTFVVRSSDVDESVSPGLTPAQVVESLSARKGEAVAAEAAPGDLVLSADTVVALDGAILGKPRDRAEAEAMLTALSGRTHQVYTGVTLLQDGRRLTEHEVTAVTFRPLSPGEIAAYVSTGEPMDKAGAYGIQGLGALLVERLEGDYFNVMGLPLCRLGEMLAQFGVRPLEAAGLRRE